jgi:hypothetical protein
VTFAPETALPSASDTCTARAIANAWLTTALCGVPPVAAIAAARPATLVSANVACAPEIL